MFITISFAHLLWGKLIALSSNSNTMIVWTWIGWQWLQMHRFTVFTPLTTLWNGTVFLNMCLTIFGGANIHSTAKIFSTFRDFPFYKLDEMSIINDKTYWAGHVLNENELIFGKSTVSSFASTQAYSILFAGSYVPSGKIATSWSIVPQKQ